MSPSDRFLTTLEEAKPRLKEIGFVQKSVIRNGHATYVEYAGTDASVLMMYGPSEWHVEMVATLGEQRFELKDLLQIPEIMVWAKNNRPVSEQSDPLKDEIV